MNQAGRFSVPTNMYTARNTLDTRVNINPNNMPTKFASKIYPSGTRVRVGDYWVTVEKYLSEGGFAHIYLTLATSMKDGTSIPAVLKRVAVPDIETLGYLRMEVETMKLLKGNRHIVTYLDSNISSLHQGGYEVFLLMEYCNGGGLIDLMNTRLQNRLTELEVLQIFSDVVEGVSCLHSLEPPLIHRDIKIENVLISNTNYTTVYKLCDFGSAALPRAAAKSYGESRMMEDDIARNTTPQYRSPEMVEVLNCQRGVDDKSDIWALGILLYKLCFYTTPFENQGLSGIVSSPVHIPSYPVFSKSIVRLIHSMLQKDPNDRPSIYGVLKELGLMKDKEYRMKNDVPLLTVKPYMTSSTPLPKVVATGPAGKSLLPLRPSTTARIPFEKASVYANAVIVEGEFPKNKKGEEKGDKRGLIEQVPLPRKFSNKANEIRSDEKFQSLSITSQNHSLKDGGELVLRQFPSLEEFNRLQQQGLTVEQIVNDAEKIESITKKKSPPPVPIGTKPVIDVNKFRVNSKLEGEKDKQLVALVKESHRVQSSSSLNGKIPPPVPVKPGGKDLFYKKDKRNSSEKTNERKSIGRTSEEISRGNTTESGKGYSKLLRRVSETSYAIVKPRRSGEDSSGQGDVGIKYSRLSPQRYSFSSKSNLVSSPGMVPMESMRRQSFSAMLGRKNTLESMHAEGKVDVKSQIRIIEGISLESNKGKAIGSLKYVTNTNLRDRQASAAYSEISDRQSLYLTSNLEYLRDKEKKVHHSNCLDRHNLIPNIFRRLSTSSARALIQANRETSQTGLRRPSADKV